jgi:ubiquitin-protein ligase
MTSVIKRIINKDIKELKSLNLEEQGIYIEFNEENMLKAHAMIIGPGNTPYENGILFFEINFPTNYPYSPPEIHYYSYSRYRIHPNLYVGKSTNNHLGKVCLSIINTWAGPGWTTIMHIGSVLLSIQSLLCDNPIQNEPGFENEIGIKNDTYNRLVEYDTFSHLILNNGFKISSEYLVFNDMIKNHLDKNKDNILKKLEDLKLKYPNKEKVTLDIYSLSRILNYDSLYKVLYSTMNKI